MPRSVPHFKVRLSVQNHRKMIGVYDDDALLAMWVRIGMMAVERFADRTGNSFLASGADLCRLAGCQPVANARRKLGRLEAGDRLEVGQDGAWWRLTLFNFAEVQGFKQKNRTETGVSSSSSSSSSSASTKEQEKKEIPAAGATANGPRPKPLRVVKSRAPDALDIEQQAALATWCATKHPDALDRLPALTEACLDYHRSKGNTHADWLATCRTWIRNEATGVFGSKPRGQPQGDEEFRAEVRRIREQHAQEDAEYARQKGIRQ